MPDALPDTGLQHSSSAMHDSDCGRELDAAMATHADELGHSPKPSTVAGVSDTDSLPALAEQASHSQHHVSNGLAQQSSHERSPIEGVTGDQVQPVGISAAQKNALAAIRARRTGAEETYGDRLGGCPVVEQGANANLALSQPCSLLAASSSGTGLVEQWTQGKCAEHQQHQTSEGFCLQACLIQEVTPSLARRTKANWRTAPGLLAPPLLIL